MMFFIPSAAPDALWTRWLLSAKTKERNEKWIWVSVRNIRVIRRKTAGCFFIHSKKETRELFQNWYSKTRFMSKMSEKEQASLWNQNSDGRDKAANYALHKGDPLLSQFRRVVVLWEVFLLAEVIHQHLELQRRTKIKPPQILPVEKRTMASQLERFKRSSFCSKL